MCLRKRIRLELEEMRRHLALLARRLCRRVPPALLPSRAEREALHRLGARDAFDQRQFVPNLDDLGVPFGSDAFFAGWQIRFWDRQ